MLFLYNSSGTKMKVRAITNAALRIDLLSWSSRKGVLSGSGLGTFRTK